MGLWDNISNIMSGGGRNDMNRGYNEANGYLDPYRTGGLEDYNKYRAYVAGQGKDLDQYGNPADWMYKNINQSPNAFYDKIMGGYSESPEAKYAMEQAMRGSAFGASASGMMGSGAFMKALQENANGISQRDRQQYFNNVMGANDQQMRYLENFQRQKGDYANRLNGLAGIGYDAANNMGMNAIGRGRDRAYFDQNAFDSIMGLIGAGGQNYKNNSMSNAAGGAQIPWYLMMM